MDGRHAEMLRKPEARVSVWRILAISLTTICLVSGALLIFASFTGKVDIALVAAIILFPLWAVTPFIINHWLKLDIEKEALAHHVQNADHRSEIFFQLLERYISGGLEESFGKMGLTLREATFDPSGEGGHNITVSARKGKYIIRAVFSRTSFSLDVDDDEEEDIRKAIRYPGSDSLAELADMINTEIQKRTEKKNGKF